MCSIVDENVTFQLAITNSLAFYKVVEQSSRLGCSSSDQLCCLSSALGCLLHIPGLLSGDPYKQLLPSWDHSKAYMSALATSIKMWISAVQRVQKGGESWGRESRVAGKLMDQEGLEGLEVPESVTALTALGAVLQELLMWSAREAVIMSSSSGNVRNAVTSSAGVFGAPEQLFAPPGIQLVVLLWAARGLGVVGPLLLPFANVTGDAEVAAIYESAVNESRSTRSRRNNVEGIEKSGKAVVGGSSSSSYGNRGSVESSSSSVTGGSSSSTGDEGSRGLVSSGVLKALKPLNMLMTTSLCLIQAMDNWQSAALCSGAAAEPTVGTGHGLSSAASATGPNSSSAQGEKAAARGAAAAVTAAAAPLVAERKVRSVGADPSSSSSAGDAMAA